MLGTITLIIALGAQLALLVYRLRTKNTQTKARNMMRIAGFLAFSLLLLAGVYWWGFRWMGLFITLAVLALLGALGLVRPPKTQQAFRASRAVLSCVSGCFLLAFGILPGIIFPQFAAVQATGELAAETTSYTYIDSSRVDPFSEKGENRKLTVQFWYPANTDAATFPLVVFSHGAFGFRGSNLSTFENLASHGYVVCSIDHSYQSFFASHADGSRTLIKTDFLNDAVNVQNGAYGPQTSYQITSEWLALRTADMAFVLDTVLAQAASATSEPVFALINPEEIGLFGHSLGGATAAAIGRERSNIDAVVVIDGTMLGERIGTADGQTSLITEPYPLPLLNLYNDSHYQTARSEGTAYENISASTNAIEAYDVVIRDSGHLNFTDLPLFSPLLARMLGTGTVDSRYCIETMNDLVLRFFDYALKGAAPLDLQITY